MREQEFIHIGFIHQSHGLNGEVSIAFNDNSAYHRLVQKGSFCFIEVKNKTYIPYQIKHIQKQGLNAYVSFDMYDTIEKAKTITGKKLYLHVDQVPQNYKQEFKEMWMGYSVIHADTEEIIGTITAIHQLPGQLVADVMCADKDVMIPLNDDFINETDHNKKTIKMEIPDGLLDI